jgi:hypothetical protein
MKPLRLAAALAVSTLALAACGGEGNTPADALDSATARFTRAKLCNFLAGTGGEDITVTLEVGQPPARITAVTGKCSAEVDQPCTAIPSGVQPIRIAIGSTELAHLDVTFAADHEYVLGTAVDPASKRLRLKRVELSDTRCNLIDPQLLILAGAL